MIIFLIFVSHFLTSWLRFLAVSSGTGKFSGEFKLEAIELREKIGFTKTGQELDIDLATLLNWRNKQKSNSASDGKKSYAELEQEIRRLSKENGYLKEINKVLKKAQRFSLTTEL